MKFSYSQPYFIPYPGLFLRAFLVDKFVLLDRVQFPRGFTWLRRNRLKGKDGTLWLTVPIMRKGMGLVPIDTVKIFYGEDWRRKHLLSIKHSYKNSPYFEEIFYKVEKIYERKHKFLLDLNLEFLHFIREGFRFQDNFILQSKIKIKGKKVGLILKIAEKLGADTVLLPPSASSHIDVEALERRGLKVEIFRYKSPIYPQLWGDFIKDLSAIDILFNLGVSARDHVLKFNPIKK